MRPLIALVSCVKSKREEASAAKDLYTSALFRGMRSYAEATADTWYILSAEYGLLDPNQRIEPYEKTLNRMPVTDRRSWADRVKAQLADVLPTGAEVIILAGERYREELVPFLENRGHKVSIPLAGLSFGRQLSKLNELAAIRET
jgi:cytoplasmic iron level regulating protein YaaA (DUF328/UPF0246 family)